MLGNLSRFPTLLSSAQYAQAAAGAPKLTFKKYEPPLQEHHDVKNARLSRPLSPVIIYQPQLTTILSITHRISGETCFQWQCLYAHYNNYSFSSHDIEILNSDRNEYSLI